MTTLAYSLKELPLSERPRERLMLHGPQALSSSELIALILGSGTKGKSVLALSQELLSHFGSLHHLLDASIEDLCRVKGLGKAKAVQLKAALSQAYLGVRDLIVHEKKEIFGAILLDAKGAVIRWEVISVGTLTNAIVHPREVFYSAIKYLAASLILVHNHPSGDPTPSFEDRFLTEQLIEASHAISIPILDHLVIGNRGYSSLKERGLSFSPDPIV
jgi:DNA repair protein RadC